MSVTRLFYILFAVCLLISGVVYIGVFSIDGDGLYYEEELEHNTDPFNYDTDNDGLSDKFEVENGYNPRKKTILLTIHSEEQLNNKTKEYIKDIQKEFAEAPINNPNGTQGINLYIEYKRINNLGQSKVSMVDYEKDIRSRTFKKRGQGYYNLLIVDNVCVKNTCQVTGVSNYFHSGALVERKSSKYMTVTMMHELGHMTGITSLDYDGVDSKTKTKEEYSSVMNYNTSDELQYATEPFNDWNHIEKSILYKTNTSQTDNILVSTYKELLFIVNMTVEHPSKIDTMLYTILFE